MLSKPSLSVSANISFHARLAGRHDRAWEEQLISALGLQDFLGRYPEQLSGGQQQRVAIGRTLAARPPLILADEPTGNLDEETGDRVLELMLALARSAGSALLFVTHSTRLADRLDRKVVLRGGRIVSSLTKDLVFLVFLGRAGGSAAAGRTLANQA